VTVASTGTVSRSPWWAAWIGEWPLALVLLTIGAGLAVVADNHFKRGTVLFAGGVCLAALLRALLPNARIGLLAVRSRGLDVITLAALGTATVVVAVLVPPPA
jgi:hypothetical protein